MSSTISVQLVCPCNNRTYATPQSLKAHKQTKCHIFYETTDELKKMKIELTHRDNTISQLQLENSKLRDLYLNAIININKVA